MVGDWVYYLGKGLDNWFTTLVKGWVVGLLPWQRVGWLVYYLGKGLGGWFTTLVKG